MREKFPLPSWKALIGLGLLWTSLGVEGVGAPGAASAVPAPDKTYEKQILPILQEVCYDCHGEGTKKGGFALDGFKALDTHLKDITHWYSVWKNLETQLMPPAEKPQPTEAQRQELLRWIERSVFRVDAKNPDPGRVTVRRLNREEYQNTVLDLFGVKFETDDAFPVDDTGYGFDTIGDVLTLSPLLMEKYLEAAQKIVDELAGNFGPRIPTVTLPGDKFVDAEKKRNGRWMPFAKEVKPMKLQRIEHPGRYRMTATLSIQGSAEASENTGNLELLAGEQTVATKKLGWEFRKDLQVVGEVDLAVGEHALALSLTPGAPPLEDQKPLAVNVSKVELYGPLDRSFVEYPPQYQRIFMDGPPKGDAKEKAAYRRKVLSTVASRAFRRPVDNLTLDRLVKLAEAAEVERSGSFEMGVSHALCAIMVSPRFLFRSEIQAEPNNPGKIVAIDEFALASRLSYFLWSSLPDEELARLAREGKLRSSLRAQVDRMLADPRSQRFVENFVGQWLQTRDVEGLSIDFARLFGEKKTDYHRVRVAMRQETEMFFAQNLAQNLPALELLGADYTYLNESLASYYGIEGVKGNEMRKVSLSAESPRRGGILTQGSTLLVTSNPTRTSPVKRGLFVLENILGAPAPPAPPNVPPLEQAKKKGGNLTMRQVMEVHRKEALCASCHARMDPLGLALENFTYGGTFRDNENGKPIDTAGQLITGEKFTNMGELTKILMSSRKDDFYRCLAEKLLTYGIGRGLEYYDTVTVENIVAGFKADHGTLRAMIYQIIESAPFQKRRGTVPELPVQNKLMKHLLSRRYFLRGLGVSLGLPFLESVSPLQTLLAASGPKLAVTKDGRPLRMAFLYTPNGVNLSRWRPIGEGADYQLNESMSSLAPFREHFQIVSGLDQKNGTSGGDGGGDHARANSSILTGVRPKKTAGSDIHLGISVDQLAAQHVGDQTRFSSLELSCDSARKSGACDSGYSCAYQFNVSWRSETFPVAPESNPRLVFERLFGSGKGADRQKSVHLRQSRQKSILDFVMEDATSLRKDLGRNDQGKLDEYLTGVREIETRIQKAEQFGPLPDPKMESPAGIPMSYQDHIRLMMDMQILAFQTDSTRISTFMLAYDGSNRSFKEIGVSDGHHNLSHHQDKPETLAKIAQIDQFYLSQFAYYLKRMNETKDGTHSLLDNSMIVYCSGLADGNRHSHDNLPVILAGHGGGQITSGRHLNLGKIPMTNLYVRMLNLMGVPAERFGDSTGVANV